MHSGTLLGKPNLQLPERKMEEFPGRLLYGNKKPTDRQNQKTSEIAELPVGELFLWIFVTKLFVPAQILLNEVA